MLTLQPMSEESYAQFKVRSIEDFTHSKIQEEGTPEEDAIRLANEAFEKQLPQGTQSEDQFLFDVLDTDSNRVGWLWFAKKTQHEKTYAWLYNIIVEVEHRGKGYGKQMMQLLEAEAKRQNLQSIGLHVFGSNQKARALYEGQGYQPTNLVMYKELI